MELLINYKKRFASRFIPLEGETAQQELPDADSFVYSEKLDGHLGYAVVKDGNVSFYNRSATLLNLPNLAGIFPKEEGVWAGELYIKQDRSRSFLVSGSVANESDQLCFAVFDAVHQMEQPVNERMDIVTKHIPHSDRVHPVKWHTSESKKEVLAVYKEWVDAGKEGIIVQPGKGMLYKLKPKVELDLAVLGYSMKEDGSGIRSLLVGVKNNENQWMVVASVGGGFKEEDRVVWMNRLEPMVVEGDIVLVAKNKLAYKWVKPEIVIQIKCIEVINEDSSGIIFKEILSYDETAKQYVSEGKTAGVSIVSPVFVTERTDKKTGVEDTGINQIADRVEIVQDAAGQNENNISSDILFRKVYTKSGKGGTAVRKFVGVKTNRTQDFPEYYLFFTDFSAGRKDPLKTEINLASNEELLKTLLTAAIEENIKKGWEEVGG